MASANDDRDRDTILDLMVDLKKKAASLCDKLDDGRLARVLGMDVMVEKRNVRAAIREFEERIDGE